MTSDPATYPTGGTVQTPDRSASYTGTVSNYGLGADMANGPSYVICSGAITTKWRWVPDNNDPADVHPASVIVRETSMATANSSDGPSYVNVDSGLGFPTLTDPLVSAYGVVSMGTRYTLKAGADLITVTCSPYASAYVVSSGGGSPPPTDDGGGTGSTGPVGGAGVRYSVSISPVTVEYGGTGLGASWQRRYLVGLPVVATLQTGGLSPDSNGCTWSVSGGKPFKDFAPTSSNSNFTALNLGTEKGTSVSYFYADAGTGTDSASAHLVVPAGCLPTAGLDVSATRQCSVELPNVDTKTPQVGASGIWRIDNETYKWLCPGPYDIVVNGQTLHKVGVGWPACVTTPDAWVAVCGQGQFAFVQIIAVTASIERDAQPTPEWWDAQPSAQGVDGTYPYQCSCLVPPDAQTSQHACDGSWIMFQDTPYIELRTLSIIQASESFSGTAFLMYQPGGASSKWVPLWKWPWSWAGTATRQANDYAFSGGQNPSASGTTPWHDHPVWTRNVTLQWVKRP